MQPFRVPLVHDVAVSLVPPWVEFVIHERVGSGNQEDGFSAAHLSDFGGINEVSPLNLQVLARAGRLPGRLVVGHLMDGLLANHLRNFLVRGIGFSTEEEGRVAAVHNGLGLLVVLRFQLAHGLEDNRDADVPGACDCDGLLNLRDSADVRELVKDEVNRPWQLTPIVRERLPAELVDALPHHDGKEER